MYRDAVVLLELSVKVTSILCHQEVLSFPTADTTDGYWRTRARESSGIRQQ